LYTINCKGALIDLSIPKVMGIINVTPDSFYDGGKTLALLDIISQAEQMINEGATFLDVGGYSSRPGADEVSETEELRRVLPAIEALGREFPDVLISVDTFRSAVAKAAIEHGAALINDISGGKFDVAMIPTAVTLAVPYIAMHIRGTPKTMSTQTNYDNVARDVLFYFSERIAEARTAGINDIIVDPGFGFAKTRQQSFELLNNLELFQGLNVPLLVGISRKSMINKTLQTSPEGSLNGTTTLHSIALLKGASILRVHDVKEAVECVTLLQELKSSQNI